jgi:hypothetical protein
MLHKKAHADYWLADPAECPRRFPYFRQIRFFRYSYTYKALPDVRLKSLSRAVQFMA